MEGLGKLLRKGVMPSAHSTTQYERVNTDPSDDDDEEVVGVVQDGEISRQNGQAAALLKKEILNGGDEHIELGDLGLKKARIRSASEVEVKGVAFRALTRTRIQCILLLFLLASLVVACVVLWPYLSRHVFKGHYYQTQDWSVTVDEYGTETCVRLVDVDEDGVLDVIFNVIDPDAYGDISVAKSQAEFCRKKGLPDPCIGKLVALRGRDGQELWSTYIHSDVFEMNCGNIDINKDGKMDCIASGRMKDITAFDPRSGNILWSGDNTTMINTWNNYNVVVLSDFTGDGVPEVLLAHGGDPKYPPQKHKRKAGRLVLLDGATGKGLGQYLEMPGSRETYMSPVLHQRKDGSQYILFGHGGETVPGSFLAISVPDLYRYAKKLKPDDPVPNMNGSYKGWEKLSRNENGIMEIYKSPTVGVMVPPLCIDMNDDGVRDILMTAFDGTYILYDGESLQKLWTSTVFAGYESYSTPAPGHFNEDATLDFMVHQNHGNWPAYDSSTAAILDGKTGELLWSMNSSKYEMTSGLVAMTTEPNRDMFVFRVKGRLGSGTADKQLAKKRKKRSQAYQEYPFQDDIYNTQARGRVSPEDAYEYDLQGVPSSNQGYGQLSPVRLGAAHQQQQQQQQQPQPYYRRLGINQGQYAPGAARRPGFQSPLAKNYYSGGQRARTLGSQYATGLDGTRAEADERTEGADDDPGMILGRYPVDAGTRTKPPVSEEVERSRPSTVDGRGTASSKDTQELPRKVVGYAPAGWTVSDPDYHKQLSEGDRSAEHEPEHHSHTGAAGQGDDDDEDDDDDDNDDVPEASEPSVYCTSPSEYIQGFITEFFIMDRTTASKPLRVLTLPADKFKHKASKLDISAIKQQKALEEQDQQQQNSHMGRRRRRRVKRHGNHMHTELDKVDPNMEVCYVSVATERSTGALGDMDGDGTLDMVVVDDGSTQVHDVASDRYVRTKMYTTIKKVNLETMIKHADDYVPVQVRLAPKLGAVQPDAAAKSMSELTVRPASEQVWTAYLGGKSDSIYHGVPTGGKKQV